MMVFGLIAKLIKWNLGNSKRQNYLNKQQNINVLMDNLFLMAFFCRKKKF